MYKMWVAVRFLACPFGGIHITADEKQEEAALYLYGRRESNELIYQLSAYFDFNKDKDTKGAPGRCWRLPAKAS